MKETLRLSMSWLHTWAGLWASWVLFAIFFTGTLGVFDDAITSWMKPEQAPVPELIKTTEERAQAIRFAQHHFEKVAPQSDYWSVGLPSEENTAVRLFWEDADKHPQNALLNPKTGELIPKTISRDTEGGHHFVHLHYELHSGTVGIWIVGFFAMAMLVGLISGIIIHKRIFKDFFTFRPGKNQRSWLDAHNAVAVLTLPFQIMITYTGLAIFFSLYMPAGISANYDNSNDFFSALLAQPEHREETHIKTAMTPLDVLLTKTELQLQRDTSFVVVEHAGDTSALATVYGPFDEGKNEDFLVNPDGGKMIFDAVNGEVLDTVMPRGDRGGPIWVVQQAMAALHMATFGGYTIKWLYFICGMAGAAMIATGTILFMVKRHKKLEHEFGAQTQRVYRFIEATNVGAIAGLMLACVAYLWINRLLPLNIENRSSWEIRAFFIIWFLTFVHSAFRHARKAWVEQLSGAALLCIALPVLNILTTHAFLVNYFLQKEWLRFATELTVFGIGVLLTFSAWKVSKAPVAKKSRAARMVKQKSVTETATTEAGAA